MEEFGAVLGTTAKQIEAKHQFKKISEKVNEYVLQEFYNPKYIIVMLRGVKILMVILNTSGPTSLSTEDNKYPIVVMIQTEKIKKHIKKDP